MLTLRTDVIGAEERARVRAALDATGWRSSGIADRLRLETATLDHPLVARLTTLAGEVVGAALRPVDVCWMRLRRGDYQLTKGDARARPPEPHVELIADLSAAATGEAEIFYGDGPVVAQLPGAAVIVERDATSLRWQRYLTLRVGDAAVYRLRLTLVRG